MGMDSNRDVGTTTPDAAINLTDRIVGFLCGIGIDVHEETLADSFLPGVRIVDGGLRFDRKILRWPGDLLHEAGHIAVVPAPWRATLNDALEDQVDLPHVSEIEATAWAFAAITHLGLDPSVLFHEGGYGGKSAGLIMTYSLGIYPGCFGLAQAGMTLIGQDALRAGLPAYPHMIRWLRE
jgi:hypothetical protein